MRLRMSRGMAAVMILSLAGGIFAFCTGVHTRKEMGAWLATLAPVAAAILLHEAGHILTARLCGVRMSGLRIDLFGARLKLTGMMSYRREAAIAAAGPAVNLLSAAVILLPLYGAGAEGIASYLAGGEAGGIFALSSVALAAINLLPVRSLDGGRILRCVLAPVCGERVADAALNLGTALCLGALWAFSVYALLRVGEMLSLFAFSVCLLCRMMGVGVEE